MRTRLTIILPVVVIAVAATIYFLFMHFTVTVRPSVNNSSKSQEPVVINTLSELKEQNISHGFLVADTSQYSLTFSDARYYPDQTLLVLDYFGKLGSKSFWLGIREVKASLPSNTAALSEYEQTDHIVYDSDVDGIKLGKSDKYPKIYSRFVTAQVQLIVSTDNLSVADLITIDKTLQPI